MASLRGKAKVKGVKACCCVSPASKDHAGLEQFWFTRATTCRKSNRGFSQRRSVKRPAEGQNAVAGGCQAKGLATVLLVGWAVVLRGIARLLSRKRAVWGSDALQPRGHMAGSVPIVPVFTRDKPSAAAGEAPSLKRQTRSRRSIRWNFPAKRGNFRSKLGLSGPEDELALSSEPHGLRRPVPERPATAGGMTLGYPVPAVRTSHGSAVLSRSGSRSG